MSLKESDIKQLTQQFEERLRFIAENPSIEPSADRLRDQLAIFVGQAADLKIRGNELVHIVDAAVRGIAQAILLDVFAEDMRETLSHVIREEMKKAASPTSKTA